jgi:hypothetical protein
MRQLLKYYKGTLRYTRYALQKLNATANARILINQRTSHLQLAFGSG